MSSKPPKVTFGSPALRSVLGPSRPPSPTRESSPSRLEEKTELSPDPLTALVEHSRKKMATTTKISFQCPIDVLKVYAEMMNIAIEVNPGSPPHTHPRLALERRLAIDHIFSSHTKWSKTGIVYDIGASMVQHRGRNFVHGLCPTLTPADVYRNGKYAEICPEARYCLHTMEQVTEGVCDCVSHAVAAISVHSMYYLNPVDIVRFLKLKGITMYAVVHRFKELEGSIHEMVYNKEGLEVVAKIAGESYQHSSLDWLDAPSCALNTEAGTLGWHLEVRIGMTWVYAMYYSSVAAPEHTLQFENAITDLHAFGNINLGKLNTQHATHIASLVNFTLDLPVTAISIGGYLEVVMESKTKVVIPKPCFHELLFTISMVPRTADNFATHISKAKKLLLDYKMSPEMRAKIIGPLTVLTFFWNVKAEEAILQAGLRKFGTWATQLSETLKFAVRPYITLRNVALTVAGVAGLFYSIKRLRAASVFEAWLECANYAYQIAQRPVTHKEFDGFLKHWFSGQRISTLAPKFLAYMTFNVLAEEVFKWVVPNGDHLIVAFELIVSVIQNGSQGAIDRLIPSLVHYVHRKNKVAGFATHWIWNYVAYTSLQNILQGRGILMETPILALLVLCLVGNIYTYLVVLAKPVPVTIDDFVHNYEHQNKGTVFPDGVTTVAPVTLKTKTVEYKQPPPHAHAKVDVTAPEGKDRRLVNLVFGVPTRPPVVYGATLLNELAAVSRCVGGPTTSKGMSRGFGEREPDAYDMQGHTFSNPEDYICSWFGPVEDDLESHRPFHRDTTILIPVVCNSFQFVEHKMGDPDFDAWIKRYPESKRSQLLRALQERSEGFAPKINLKGFVKAEKVNNMTEEGLIEKDPRMINATDVTVNEYLGPYIHMCSKAFARAVNPMPFAMNGGKHGDPLVKLHVMLDGDYLGLNKWVSLAEELGAVWFEADVTRMDGNYSERSMNVVHHFYHHINMMHEVLQYVIEMQKLRYAYTRHGVSYEMDHKRASGEPDTSFGNTILSISMALIALEDYLDTTSPSIQQVLLCVLGDDVLMGVIYYVHMKEPINYSSEIIKFGKLWEKAARFCGHTLKVSGSRHLARMSYLSGVFWPVPDQIPDAQLPEYYPERKARIIVALGVKPGRWFLRAGWILDNSCDYDRVLAIFRGSLVSNDFLTAHVPVVSYLAHIFMKKLPQRTIILQEDRAAWKNDHAGPHKLQIDLDNPQLDQAFFLRYGRHIGDFAPLLKQIDDAPLPMFIMHPLVQKLIKVDM